MALRLPVSLVSLFRLLVIAIPVLLAGCGQQPPDHRTGAEICPTSVDSLSKAGEKVLENEGGPVTNVMKGIVFDLRDASQRLFNGFAQSGLRQVVSLMIILYIALFGSLLALGMEHLTLGNAIMRAMKIGVIAGVFSETGFDFMFDTAGKFFLDGTEQLIDMDTQQVVVWSKVTIDNPGEVQTLFGNLNVKISPEDENYYQLTKRTSAFIVLDIVLAQFTSENAFRFYLASLLSFPYGWFYVLMLLFAVFYYLSAVAQAIWVYLLSSLAKVLLLELAPFFIVLMLFKYTKRFFDSWIMQLINFTLQPVIIFTFLAMYTVLIDTAFNAVFAGGKNISVCYWKITTFGVDGWAWVFGTLGPDGQTVHPISTTSDQGGSVGTDSFNHFPLLINDVLVLLMVCWLAHKFLPAIGKLSSELTRVYIDTSNSYYQPSMRMLNPYSAAGKARGLVTGAPGDAMNRLRQQFAPRPGGLQGAPNGNDSGGAST